MVFGALIVVPMNDYNVRAATTHYVYWGGGYDYTTISAAISAATPGDTIYVYNGSYNEVVNLDKTLILIGQDRNTTVINGNGKADHTVYIQDAPNIQISGFTIMRSSVSTLWDGIRMRNSLGASHTNTVSNVNIYNHNYGIGIFSATNIISNCKVHNNNIGGIYFSSSIGNPDNNVVKNCDIYSNPTYGIKVGADFWAANNNKFYHNNIYSNGDNAIDYTWPNTWDDGYPSGGNWWGDYGGVDGNGDGIGDTAYTIDADDASSDGFPLISPFDIEAPESSTNSISSYWQNNSPLSLTCAAIDHGLSGLSNITLWYNYSSDNVSWTGWESYGTDYGAPWSWSFNYPYGEGYYSFYSIANDMAGNSEPPKTGYDSICGLNINQPVLSPLADNAQMDVDWSYNSASPFVFDVSPEGEYAVIGDDSGNLRLFHEESSVPLWSHDIGTVIQNVSIAEDGDFIGVIVDNLPTLYSKYGDRVFPDFEKGEIENNIDVTWEGKHSVVGYTNTMNIDLWRMEGGTSEIRCQGSNNLPSNPQISGSGGYIASFDPSSPTVAVWNGTSRLIPQTLGEWQNPRYTFTDPIGNINDIAMSYDGDTVVVGSSSADFGIINRTGWYWQTSATTLIVDVDISNDGNVFTALDNLGFLYVVYPNKTFKTLSTTFTNAELSGDGKHIACSDLSGTTGLTILDIDLEVIAQNNLTGDFDLGTLHTGNNGHHIWGRTGQSLHHIEVMPQITHNYTSEYFASGYFHVNETTEFSIHGYSVAEEYQMFYNIDGRSWGGYSGPFNLTGLLPGPHTIEYYIEDSSGYYTGINNFTIWLDSYGFYNDTEARLTHLENQVSKLWASVNSINSTIVNLNTSITGLSNEVTNLTSNLTSLAYNVSQHWNFTDNMTVDIDNLQLEITILQQNVSNHWNYTGNMTTDINSLELVISLLQQNVSSHWNHTTNMTITMNNMQTNITSTQQNLSEHWDFTDNMTVRIDDIVLNVTTLQGDHSALSYNVSQHWNFTDNMTVWIDSIEFNVTNLQLDYLSLLYNVSQHWNFTTNISLRVGDNEVNITTLQSNYAAIFQNLSEHWNFTDQVVIRIDGIEIDVTTLQNDYIALLQNVSNHWNITDLMGSDICTLKINVTDLQNNVTALWENITSLQNNQSNIWNNISQIIQRIDSLEINDTLTNENITALNDDLYNLESSLATYYNNLNALTDRVINLESGHQLTEQELNYTNWDLYNTTTALHAVEDDIEHINQDIALLEGDVDTNADEIIRANEDDMKLESLMIIYIVIAALAVASFGLIGMRYLKKHEK